MAASGAALFLACLLFNSISCRPPQPPPVSIWLLPETGSLGDVVDVGLYVKVAEPVTAFGLEVLFNPEEMAFANIQRGSLTATWHALGWHEVEPGRVILGGYMGAAAKMREKTEGTMLILQIRLRTPQTSICIAKYVDGLRDAFPARYCAEVRIAR